MFWGVTKRRATPAFVLPMPPGCRSCHLPRVFELHLDGTHDRSCLDAGGGAGEVSALKVELPSSTLQCSRALGEPYAPRIESASFSPQHSKWKRLLVYDDLFTMICCAIAPRPPVCYCGRFCCEWGRASSADVDRRCRCATLDQLGAMSISVGQISITSGPAVAAGERVSGRRQASQTDYHLTMSSSCVLPLSELTPEGQPTWPSSSRLIFGEDEAGVVSKAVFLIQVLRRACPMSLFKQILRAEFSNGSGVPPLCPNIGVSFAETLMTLSVPCHTCLLRPSRYPRGWAQQGLHGL